MWRLKLAEYNLNILVYKKVQAKSNADSLSRIGNETTDGKNEIQKKRADGNLALNFKLRKCPISEISCACVHKPESLVLNSIKEDESLSIEDNLKKMQQEDELIKNMVEKVKVNIIKGFVVENGILLKIK